MDFTPEHDFQPAVQRMRQAHYLYKEGASFAPAIYSGGLAVECLLRAFKGRRDSTFDDQHHRPRLFAASGLLSLDREKLRAKHWSDAQIDEHLKTLRVAVNEIFRLWSNGYRYAAEERLRSHLKQITGFQRIREDYLKEQSRQFLNAAQTFIDKGALLWHV